MKYLEEYQHRRQQVLREIGGDAVAIIPGAKEKQRNADNTYPFRQYSDFYYLTGFNEPEAIAVLAPGCEKGPFLLFNQPRDPNSEIWHGARAGQEGACEIYGADGSFPIEQLDAELPKLLRQAQRVYYPFGRDMAFDRRVFSWINSVRSTTRGDTNVLNTIVNVEPIIHEMRLHKSPLELQLMRKAAAVSAEAHCAAMKICRPGLHEYDLEAELQYWFTHYGSRAPAYNHIVGTGANTCTLHYNANNALIQDGDLVLIDAGAEFDYYAADITRTFPANGRFSPTQQAVYEAVLTAQLAVIDLIKPGVPWGKLQEESDRVITEQLLHLGLLSGNLAELLEKGAARKFYVHKIGHWLGLDVHDVGSYRSDGQWRLLEPGMVVTVEPGIYIPAGSEGVAEKWGNIGVRIEDDVLVTDQGCEVLSAGAPKTVMDIEALMEGI